MGDGAVAGNGNGGGSGYQIQRVTHKHDAIINWLVMYPHRKLQDCAEFFGISQSWLSVLIHSDMFQAEYRKRAAEMNSCVVHDLKSRVAGLAAVAVEETQRRIETGVASERFVTDATKNALLALGYGTPAVAAIANNAVQQNLHVHVDAGMIVEARERAAAARQGSTPAKIVLEEGDAA